MLALLLDLEANYFDKDMIIDAKYNHLEIIKLLASHGADAWDWALRDAMGEEVRRFLLAKREG